MSRRLWVGALLLGGAAMAAPPGYDALLADGCDQRLQAFHQTSRTEKEGFLNALDDSQLIELGKRSLCVLGEVYQFQMLKQERVRGKLLEPQRLAVTVREAPFAVRMEVLEGPSRGMRVLYNGDIRKDQLRAREGGLLGLLAVWVDIHGRLALAETNHLVTDLGIGGILRNLEREHPRSDAAGVKRVPAGWDPAGRYCMDFVAPPGATDVYAHRSHLCLDTDLGLPVASLSTGEQGELIESVEISHLTPRVKVAADFFTPSGAGL